MSGPAMSGHPDADALAVVALGEAPDASLVSHLDGCDKCRGEVASYARAVTAGRALEAADERLEAPPRAVWDRIAADLGIDPRLLAEPTGVAAAVSEHPADVHQFVGRTDGAAPDGSAGRGTERRRSGTGLLFAASVAGVVLGAGAVLGWQALDDPTVVAAAVLNPLPDKDASGDVTLIGAGEERELNVRLDVDPPSGAYLQVWLMSPDAQRMVPVGVLEEGAGFWRVPAGLDVAEFPVVDVSVEPFDGDAAHSGNSVVRGILSAV